ncbi:hypothetical protein CURE108131_25050 [Cupriavidus respiraculi]|uniref:Uncharacterized protein n=1 Tax=Cupriavidus respiraculi TaxID=195930 RepID=A0ABM8XUZ2_9BURK|nr:hypothetical protein [Cupriavidus respiraculi]CAG9184213.1 hypothetical protein LMG21510_05041 [Cupriavidus respiraculi]
MTRVDLLPGAAIAAPVGRVRVKALLRPRKPLTGRELTSLFGRIQQRILKGGEPFGVFVIKHGRGRVFRLLSVRDPNYKVQLRVDRAQQHMIATYDGNADLGDVWDDLCSFDQVRAGA